MIFWVITSFITFIFFVLKFKKTQEQMTFSDYANWIIGIIGIWFLISFIASYCVNFIHNDDKTYKFKYNIYALEDNISVSRKYYTRFSRIDSELRYYFVRKMDSGYKSCYVNASDSYIQYTDKAPYVEVYEYGRPMQNDFIKDYMFFHFNMISGKHGLYEYIIHIPEDSIQIDYNVDLK